jgi:ADP-ribose pyrophosphatase YjhB (NUDIX family)
MPGDDDTLRFCPRCGGSLESRALQPGQIGLVCGACSAILQPDPRLAVGVVALWDGGIVLARRADEPALGLWELPGGFVERGEALETAVASATRERVGLRVTLLGILDAYSFEGQDVVSLAYAADVVGGEPQAGSDCAEVRWFAPESVPWGELAFDSTRAALRDYLRRYFPRVRLPR